MESIKNNSERIILLLKTEGSTDIATIADRLTISKEGVRQHLTKLISDRLVEKSSQCGSVGRPRAYYRLSKRGETRFPDAHAEVTVQLLKSVRQLLGENALNLLISDREKQTYRRYKEKLAGAHSLEEKLNLLTKIRSEEGYMAGWRKEGLYYFFSENHCPICAAASFCQQFCRAELSTFNKLLGPGVSIKRTHHILSGAQRCVYQIVEINP